MDKRVRLFALAALAACVSACEVETGPGATAPNDSVATPEARVVSPQRRAPSREDSVAPSPSPQEASADTLALDRAEVERRRNAALASLEDLGIRAGGADAQATSRALDLMDERMEALPEANRPAALDSLRRRARRVEARGDGAGLALVAAEAHRTLTAEASDGAKMRSEALVLSALVRAALPDWRAVREASGRLSGLWNGASGRVRADGVHDALGAAVAGVRSGAESQNATVVRLGADVVADLAGEVPDRPAAARR